jgi:hypothetical protein
MIYKPKKPERETLKLRLTGQTPTKIEKKILTPAAIISDV